MPSVSVMFLLRVSILILVVGIACGAIQRSTCRFKCNDDKSLPVCGHNGRCKFQFKSLCEIDYYNCQYASYFNRFYPLWDDICKSSKFTTCTSFYDTSKHSYLPVP